MDYVRVFVKPWDKYPEDRLPLGRVVTSDFLWVSVFIPRGMDFIREITDRTNSKEEGWIGTCLTAIRGIDEDGHEAYIVDCDPNHHSSVLGVARQIEAIAVEMGGTLLTR